MTHNVQIPPPARGWDTVFLAVCSKVQEPEEFLKEDARPLYEDAICLC